MEEKMQYLYMLIPFVIMCFWPFPSKWIGYSMALYISDAVLIGIMLLLGIKSKHRLEKTINNKFLIIFFCFNILAAIIAVIKTSFGGIRQFAEIIRVIEWFVIYNYFNNWLREINSENIEKNLYKCVGIIMIPLSIITIIELFNLPLKDLILKNMYELEKSGNIFNYYNRLCGTFRNPNMYGVFLSTISIILLVSKMDNKKKVPLLILSMAFLYYTGSRTALIVTIITYIAVIVLKLITEKNKRILWQPVVVIAVILIAIILITIVNEDLIGISRLNKMFEALATFGGRVQMWESYAEDINNNWILGNGTIKSETVMFDNVFVQYIFYYGIFGLIGLIMFFLYNIIKAIKKYLKTKDTVLLVCIAIELIIIISGITIQILDVLQLTFLYLFALAYVDTRTDLKSIDENIQ